MGKTTHVESCGKWQFSLPAQNTLRHELSTLASVESLALTCP